MWNMWALCVAMGFHSLSIERTKSKKHAWCLHNFISNWRMCRECFIGINKMNDAMFITELRYTP